MSVSGGEEDGEGGGRVGELQSCCHIFFPVGGRRGGGAYYVPCQKTLFKTKYGYEGSISNVDLGLCVSQAKN